MSAWDKQDEPSGMPDDYFVVKMADAVTCVSRETAQVIADALDEAEALEPLQPPGVVTFGMEKFEVSSGRWIVFSDLDGGAVRCRLRAIWLMYESTAATRARQRAFTRARKAEEQAEKDWSADE